MIADISIHLIYKFAVGLCYYIFCAHILCVSSRGSEYRDSTYLYRMVWPAEAVKPYIGMVDLVLIMTVEPGFGGQSFMHDQLPKVAAVRKMLDEAKLPCELEVDGGIDMNTAALAKAAGANVLVAGSAVFGKSDRADAIKAIREA